MVRTLIATVLLLVGHTAAACSPVFQPLSQPSQTEVVFGGVVAGVIGPQPGSATSALKIENLILVSGPYRRQPVLVRVFQLSAACDRIAVSESELLKMFPLASVVHIIAGVEPVGGDLEVELGGSTGVLPATADWPSFEVRKKLVALGHARTDSLRRAIVATLIPDKTGEVDLAGVIKRYVKSPNSRKSLISQCKQYWAEWQSEYRCWPPNSSLHRARTGALLHSESHVFCVADSRR